MENRKLGKSESEKEKRETDKGDGAKPVKI